MRKCSICLRVLKTYGKRKYRSLEQAGGKGYSAHPVSFGRCCAYCLARHVLPARQREGITEDFDD
jgi:hypothetical protein